MKKLLFIAAVIAFAGLGCIKSSKLPATTASAAPKTVRTSVELKGESFRIMDSTITPAQ